MLCFQCCVLRAVLRFLCPVLGECMCLVWVMLAGRRRRRVGWLGWRGVGKAEKGSVQAGAELNRTAIAREEVLYSKESQEVAEVEGSKEEEVAGWVGRKGKRPGLCALSSWMVSAQVLCCYILCCALLRRAMQ